MLENLLALALPRSANECDARTSSQSVPSSTAWETSGNLLWHVKSVSFDIAQAQPDGWCKDAFSYPTGAAKGFFDDQHKYTALARR